MRSIKCLILAVSVNHLLNALNYMFERKYILKIVYEAFCSVNSADLVAAVRWHALTPSLHLQVVSFIKTSSLNVSEADLTCETHNRWFRSAITTTAFVILSDFNSFSSSELWRNNWLPVDWCYSGATLLPTWCFCTATGGIGWNQTSKSTINRNIFCHEAALYSNLLVRSGLLQDGAALASMEGPMQTQAQER